MGEQADKFKKAINKYWPKTKKELEKAAQKSKVLLKQGEKYVRDVSVKGMKETKKISLNLKKERLYHRVGKSIANTAPSKWNATKSITDVVDEIKKIDKDIKSIK